MLSARFPFSTNLLRCLINQLASAERYLHRIAENSIKSVLSRAQADNSVTVPVLECLLCPPAGSITFDRVTKTKTIEKLITLVDDSSLMELMSVFRRLVLEPGTEDSKIAASRRQTIADLLVTTARSRQITLSQGTSLSPEASKGIFEILSVLVQFAFFLGKEPGKSQEDKESPPMSQASHDIFKARLSSCLIHFTSNSPNPTFFPYYVVDLICDRGERGTSSRPLLEMDEAVGEVVHQAWKILRKIHSKEQASAAMKSPLLTALKLLYSLTIIQVFNGDVDAVNVLEELKDCYDKLIRRNKDISGGSEILVEIILSFVAKPSQLFRRLGQQVFSNCTAEINENGLQSMSKVYSFFFPR